jgi:subtilisin-like proprotein convertase family protein
MRVTLNINHTWLNDLTITLKRGTDPAIFLHAGCGATNDLLGKYLFVDTAWEGAPASLQLVCLGARIDQGGSNPDTQFRIEAGTYRPAQGTEATGFASMRGQPLAATWTLKIVDESSHAGDTPGGTLVGWSIEARYNDPIPADCDGVGGADCLQIANDSSLDCDQNGTIDSCESMSGDCDSNGIIDRCQIFLGTGVWMRVTLVARSFVTATGMARRIRVILTVVRPTLMPTECSIVVSKPLAT